MSTYLQTNAVTIQHSHRVFRDWRVLSCLSGVIQSEKRYLYVGVLLLLAFWVQYIFELQWEWLETMQNDETLKQCSGFALASFVAHQWYLSRLRMRGCMKTAKSHYSKHKRAGVLASLLFYLHSTQLGYAYLFLLSMVYFANVVVGFCNQETLGIKKRWFYTSWIITHVSLSVVLVVLIGFHVIIAFIYE